MILDRLLSSARVLGSFAGIVGRPARHVRRLLGSERATTATEYAVMLALILLVVLGAITLLGEGVRDFFTNASDDLPEGTP